MENLKKALRWSFGTSEGHFAILCFSLAACAIGTVRGAPHAYEAAAALAIAFMIKVRG